MKEPARKALNQLNITLDRLSRDYSEPVNITETQVRERMEKLRRSPYTRGEFYHVGSVLTANVRHQANSEKFLSLGSIFMADEYIALIHEDYIAGYIDWAKATYVFLDEMSRIHGIPGMNFTFRIFFPLKYKDEKYYWTLMEAKALQVDKDDHMLTHLNKYIRLNSYDSKQKYPLAIELLDENYLPVLEWVQKAFTNLWQNASSFAHLTDAEKEILHLLFENPSLTHNDIARMLGKSQSTIKNQCKSILSRARASFPNFEIKEVKDLVLFLIPYGYSQFL